MKYHVLEVLDGKCSVLMMFLHVVVYVINKEAEEALQFSY